MSRMKDSGRTNQLSNQSSNNNNILENWLIKMTDLRRPNKTGIKIIVTDCDQEAGAMPSPVSLQTLFNKFTNLQKVDTDFKLFLNFVKNDLLEKADAFKRVKEDRKCAKIDRSFAQIQLFMILQYCQRLDRFDYLSKQSLLKLSLKLLKSCDINIKVKKHINIVMKMKRRMKSMLDTSEKYMMFEVRGWCSLIIN